MSGSKLWQVVRSPSIQSPRESNEELEARLTTMLSALARDVLGLFGVLFYLGALGFLFGPMA